MEQSQSGEAMAVAPVREDLVLVNAQGEGFDAPWLVEAGVSCADAAARAVRLLLQLKVAVQPDVRFGVLMSVDGSSVVAWSASIDEACEQFIAHPWRAGLPRGHLDTASLATAPPFVRFVVVQSGSRATVDSASTAAHTDWLIIPTPPLTPGAGSSDCLSIPALRREEAAPPLVVPASSPSELWLAVGCLVTHPLLRVSEPTASSATTSFFLTPRTSPGSAPLPPLLASLLS